jgi:sec-independent protein translocase protein TatB
MLDFNAPEFLVVAIVALVVIGPKDLPKAMRFLGKWFGKARAVARQFRSGFDNMVREAELAEMEKQWAAENERIMREHPAAQLPAPQQSDYYSGYDDAPVTVEQPAIVDAAPIPAPAAEAAPKPKRATKPKAAQPDAGVSPAPKRTPKAKVAAAPDTTAAPAPKRTRKPKSISSEAAE